MISTNLSEIANAGVCQNADFSGYAYQVARNLINRDMRDYLWFYSDDSYFLLFADSVGELNGNEYHPVNQCCYRITHYQDLEAEQPYDYWNVVFYPESHIFVDNRNGCLLYGSPSDLPDLRSGGEHYAFFFASVAICIISYRLFMDIWKWLYRKR